MGPSEITGQTESQQDTQVPARRDNQLPAAPGQIPTIPGDLIQAAYAGDIATAAYFLARGASADALDKNTGLSVLHIAVGTNNLLLCKVLIEVYGARFAPDRFGRWPTLIAAECRVNEALSDYIVEQEAKFLERARR